MNPDLNADTEAFSRDVMCERLVAPEWCPRCRSRVIVGAAYVWCARIWTCPWFMEADGTQFYLSPTEWRRKPNA